jgi:hypothetical protein
VLLCECRPPHHLIICILTGQLPEHLLSRQTTVRIPPYSPRWVTMGMWRYHDIPPVPCPQPQNALPPACPAPICRVIIPDLKATILYIHHANFRPADSLPHYHHPYEGHARKPHKQVRD